MRPFEADLCPETGSPRIRFNFSNGWSASVVLRMPNVSRREFQIASLAACPTGKWGQGLTELGQTEATPEEVTDWLVTIERRGAPA